MRMLIDPGRKREVTDLIAAARGSTEGTSHDLLNGLVTLLDRQSRCGRCNLPRELYREILLQRRRIQDLLTARQIGVP